MEQAKLSPPPEAYDIDAADVFTERLAAHARLVEDKLGTWLTPEILGPVPPQLLEAMRYGSLGGGKRLRPFLLMESAALFGIPPEISVNAAVALECVHCYSLIHDDLPAMDNDDMRRGKPTVHKAFDEASAILAGDSLLTCAFEIMSHAQTHANPAVRSALCAGLARASGAAGMAGGQMLDLQAAAQPMQEAQIGLMQSMKTGALIVFACEAGGLLGEASPHHLRALRDFGMALGSAFQLADDLLDAEGDASITGKAVKKDDSAGKATIVALLGIEKARARLNALRDKAQAALSPFRPRDAVLVSAAGFVAARKY